MTTPQKGHEALRRGRSSKEYANYFVTICLDKGLKGLNSPEVYNKSLQIFASFEQEQVSKLRSLVLMPDHIHVLFELGKTLDLKQLIHLFKGRMSPTLRSLNLRWQKGSFYDRRLRESDSIGTVVRYIWMNPYRKHLIERNDSWPFFFATSESMNWVHSSEQKSPLPEWLNNQN